jgi:hypothetical protein
MMVQALVITGAVKNIQYYPLWWYRPWWSQEQSRIYNTTVYDGSIVYSWLLLWSPVSVPSYRVVLYILDCSCDHQGLYHHKW